MSHTIMVTFHFPFQSYGPLIVFKLILGNFHSCTVERKKDNVIVCQNKKNVPLFYALVTT